MRKAKSISIKKIAEATGYNISTVSRALNNSPKISAETAAEIHAAARKMGYLAQSARKVIALILPDSQTKLGWYSINILNAIRRHTAKRGYFLECYSEDQVDILNERAMCGIISFSFRNELARKIGPKLNVPLVCINDSARHVDGVYSVFSDEFGAIRIAVSYLTGFGHRKIGMLLNGNPQTNNNKARREAFEQTLQTFNLDPVSKCLSRSPEALVESKIHYLHDKVRQLHADGITAIINTGESEALEVVHSLNYCGLKIPEDMSLITWELPEVSRFMPLNLTTIGQDFPEIAYQALNMLESLIKHQPVNSDVLVNYLFNERGSVTFPRA